MRSLGRGFGQFQSQLGEAHSVNSTTSNGLNDSIPAGQLLQYWFPAIDLLARLVAYISILALIVLVIFLIMKYISQFGDERNSEEDETNPLRPEKAMSFEYGTCDKDFETGNSSCSSSNVSSSDELYDGKLCVICYDEERNCFFVPCGHCATCYVCAQRIFTGENKVCPVCRRFIGKVRKLFAA